MIVLLHVLIALAGIGVATYTFFKPSTKKLFASYGMMIATVGSGTFLLLTTPADILKTCLTGLFYLTVTLTVTIAAQVRLRTRVTSRVHINK